MIIKQRYRAKKEEEEEKENEQEIVSKARDSKRAIARSLERQVFSPEIEPDFCRPPEVNRLFVGFSAFV